VKKLSVPVVRPKIDRGVASSKHWQGELFRGVLRDPSPISAECEAVKEINKKTMYRLSPLAGPVSTLQNMRSLLNQQRFMQQVDNAETKMTDQCTFKPDLKQTDDFNRRNVPSID